MARKLSTAAANYLAAEGSVAELHEGGVLMFYTGSQPANADAAATGTACVRFTTDSGAWTKEVKGTTVLNLASISASITALTIGGVSIISGTVTYDAPATTATALAANINAYRTYPNYTAVVSSSTTVTITAPKNSGAKLNGLTVAMTGGTGATINGGSSTTLGGTGSTAGVTQVNGLAHASVASIGELVKTGNWTGNAGSGTGAGYIGFTNAFTSGTQSIGWFRYYCSPSDPELSGTPTADTNAAYMRIDGTIATSGGDITAAGGTTVLFAAIQTANTYTLAVPVG